MQTLIELAQSHPTITVAGIVHVLHLAWPKIQACWLWLGSNGGLIGFKNTLFHGASARAPGDTTIQK